MSNDVLDHATVSRENDPKLLNTIQSEKRHPSRFNLDGLEVKAWVVKIEVSLIVLRALVCKYVCVGEKNKSVKLLLSSKYYEILFLILLDLPKYFIKINSKKCVCI